MQVVDPGEKLSVRAQCQLLGLSRSSVSYTPLGESEENKFFMRLLDERYLDKPAHGILQVQDYLQDEGYRAGEKRVRRLLRLMGLMAIYQKRSLVN